MSLRTIDIQTVLAPHIQQTLGKPIIRQYHELENFQCIHVFNLHSTCSLHTEQGVNVFSMFLSIEINLPHQMSLQPEVS